MPFTVKRKALRAISKHVLVAELNANFCGNVHQIVGVVNRKCMPPGKAGNII